MVQFEDYYKVLGVERTATDKEIRKAYRKLARKYHPDVTKVKGADAKFKKVTEAYEVLDNKEKRKKYDQFGHGYTEGQEFRPPPGFDASQFSSGGDGAGFSDFFEALFGAGAGGVSFGSGGFGGMSGMGGRSRHSHAARAPEPVRAELQISASEFVAGGTKRISIGGRAVDVRIPLGINPGATIRLAGLGGSDARGSPVDLLVKISVVDDTRYRFDGEKLVGTLEVGPGIAAVGGAITCPTPQGNIKLTVPPGIRTGQRMRLAGKGRLISSKEVGDFFVEIKVQVPEGLTKEARAIYQQLADIEQLKESGK